MEHIETALNKAVQSALSTNPSISQNTQLSTPESFRSASTWKICQGDPALIALWASAARFAAEVYHGMPPRWLTLCGASGCGKTHLARELRQWAKAKMAYYRHPELGIPQLRPCCWIDSATLASELKNGNYGYATDHYDVWMLVIDDIGAERDTSGFLSEQLLRLLNARAGKWTILTSNLSSQQIKDQLDARIADRLYRNGNVVVEISSATPSFAMRPLPQDEVDQQPTPLAPAFNSSASPAKTPKK